MRFFFLSPQCCRLVFSAISALSTSQDTETEAEYIDILLVVNVYVTQS